MTKQRDTRLGGRRVLRRKSTLLPIAAVITTAGALSAQETRDTLVWVSSLTVPDSIPLTYVEHLVSRADGSVFLIDARTDAILAFNSDGTFRRKIGRSGEGPGELLAPWRLGLIGQDTLWVVDGRRPRVNLYDASTGASLADFGPATWAVASGGGEPLRPFAVLADHTLAAVRWAERDARAEVLTLHVTEQQRDTHGKVASLDVRDRSLAVPVPNDDGSLQLRNPFSHSDMLAIDPLGRYVPIIRRREPSSRSPLAFFTVERHDVIGDSVRVTRVPYTPRPVESKDVRAWAEKLAAVERMVEVGVFPSQAAGVGAVLEAAGAPSYYPPIRSVGRGIVEVGVLFDAADRMWFEPSAVSGPTEDWLVVSVEGEVSRVPAPQGGRLLAVGRDSVWVEVRDSLGVPMIHVFKMHPLDL